jgi:hypothetical protein
MERRRGGMTDLERAQAVERELQQMIGLLYFQIAVLKVELADARATGEEKESPVPLRAVE